MAKQAFSRREFLRLSSLTAGIATLAACAPQVTPAQPQAQAPQQEALAATQAPAPTTAPSGEKEKVTLSMWTHDNLYVQFFTARAQDQEFKDQWPQYEVTTNFQQVPDVFTKMLATLSAGETVPDLFGLEQGAFPSFMADDVIGQNFVDLTPLIGAERDKFVEGTWVKYESQGKLYGVESALCSCAYYYQPAVLEKAGLKELPATWEDFMLAGGDAAKQGVYLSSLDGEGSGTFDLLFMQRGGAYFDKSNQFVMDQSPNKEMFIEVLTYLKQGVDNKVFNPFSSGDYWGAGIHAAHKEGKVLGEASADWWSDFILKPNAADQSGNWRIAPMPKWKGGGSATSTWGGTGFCVTTKSQYKELTWSLLHYGYMTEENQIKRYLEIHYLPHMLEALKDPRFTEAKDAYYADQQVGQVWAQVSPELPNRYQSPVRRDLDTELATQCTLVYRGEQTPEGAFDKVVEVTKKAIQNM